jgi:outer membrane receptor protein involved in Fe transport
MHARRFSIFFSISILGARALAADEGAAPHPRYESTVASQRDDANAASATTIHNLDFDVRPRSSPNDLLQIVPGLLTAQHQGGGKADQLFLRGFDADHGTDVALFLDGVPINLPSHAHAQGYADLHWLIPEVLERVDVQKGPYDLRWGDFATAGAINLVTRARLAESTVQATLGGFPTVNGRVAAGERFVAIAAPTLAAATRVHPWLALELARDDGPFDHAEGLARYSVLGKLTVDVSPRTSVGWLIQLYGSRWNSSGQIPLREVQAGRLSRFGAIDPSEGGDTGRQMATFFVHHEDGAGRLEATVYVTRYRLALWNDYTFYLDDPNHVSEIEQDDARWYGGGRISWRARRRRWRGISFTTTVGGEARWDGVHTERWDDQARMRLRPHVDTSSLAVGGADDVVQQRSLAAFVEEAVVPTRWLRLVGGVRADWFVFDLTDRGSPDEERQFLIASPKLSAIFTVLPGWLELYVNAGSGFHSNPAQVALADGSVRTVINGNGTTSSFAVRALPRFWGGEVGARVRIRRFAELSAVAWASYLENETVFDGDHAAFVAAAPTRRLGFDAEARARVVPGLWVDVALAQASATDVDTRNEIALAPRLYVTGGVHWRRAGWRAGLDVRYLASRPAFDEASADYLRYTDRRSPDYDPARVTAEGWFLVDVYGAYRWRMLELALGAQNLLDRDWRESQVGNHSCTFAETHDANNRNYAHCGVGVAARGGVPDVHFTPGGPLHLQLTIKAYF